MMGNGTGVRFGRYEVKAELGRGAMGVVYKAWDPKIDRWVALKTVQLAGSLPPDERSSFLHRFYREARTAGRLSHPNIVTIYDVSEESDIPFIAMEYVEGRPLDAILREGPVPWEEALRIQGGLLEALEAAHAHGIVHRDVKPANILVGADGRVRVADFGIAKLPTSQLTLDGSVLGTPNYMAPEQVRAGAIDHRADLFSAGIVLYQALTGHRPFSGPDLAAICHRILNEDPAPPTLVRPGLPSALDAVLARALSKDPAMRYQSAREFGDDLRRVAAGEEPEAAKIPLAAPDKTVVAAPTASAERTQRLEMAPAEGARAPGRRWALLSAGGIMAAIAAVAFLWPRSPAPVPTGSASGTRGTTSQAAVAPAVPEEDGSPARRAERQFLRGHALVQEGKAKAALKAYRQAVALDPSYRTNRQLLGDLIALLGSPERAGAREMLRGLGQPAVDALKEGARSRDRTTRWNAAQALEGMGMPASYLDLYSQDLQDADCRTRRGAAEALGKLQDRRAIPALQQARTRPENQGACMGGTVEQALAKLGG